MAHPESLAVIAKDAKSGFCFVAENEHGAAKGVGAEIFAAHIAEPVDTLAEVDRLYANQNPHLGGYLDHRL